MIASISGPNVLSLPNVVALELDRLKARGQETHTRMCANSREGEFPSLPGCEGLAMPSRGQRVGFPRGGVISGLTSLALLPCNRGGRHGRRVDTTRHIRAATASSSIRDPTPGPAAVICFVPLCQRPRGLTGFCRDRTGELSEDTWGPPPQHPLLLQGEA